MVKKKNSSICANVNSFGQKRYELCAFYFCIIVVIMFLLAVRRGQIVATSLVMAITEGREPLAKLRLNIAKLRQLLGVITVARVIYWIPKVENYIY